MTLINKSKKIELTAKIKHCKSIFSKATGLMFSRKNKDLALVFPFEQPQRVSLHMWFVFYSIDVLFLNEKKEVVEIKKNFKPFSFYNPKKKASYVVELIDSKTTTAGDLISF